MTTREIVKELEAAGNQVEYRIRKDGGIRITKINGVSYKGSEGNKVARKMTGRALSERREAQLRTVRTPKGRFGNPKSKKEPLDPEVVKRIRKIQRLQRKRSQKGGRTVTTTMDNYRYNLETYGKEEADKRLYHAELYARGISYPENVQWVIDRLKLSIDKLKDTIQRNIIQLCIDILERHKDDFPEKAMDALHKTIYDWEKGLARAGEILIIIKNAVKN